MRKLGIAILVIIVIVVVAVAIFAATFDVNRYHGVIQSELEHRLDRQITLGNMNLGIFPPRFRVQNLTIADDPNFDKIKPFLQAQELDVSVKLLPLLHNYQRPDKPINGSMAPTDRFRAAVQEAKIGPDKDIPHVSAPIIVKYISDLQLLGLL